MGQGKTLETVETLEFRETSETRESLETFETLRSSQTMETFGDRNLSSDRETVAVGSSLEDPAEDWETFSETSEAFVTLETREQNELI